MLFHRIRKSSILRDILEKRCNAFDFFEPGESNLPLGYIIRLDNPELNKLMNFGSKILNYEYKNDRIPPAIFVGPSLLLVICRKFVVNCLSKTFTMA